MRTTFTNPKGETVTILDGADAHERVEEIKRECAERKQGKRPKPEKGWRAWIIWYCPLKGRTR